MKLIRPWRHGNIAIDVEADGTGSGPGQNFQHPPDDAVGQRPAALSLKVGFGDGHEQNPPIRPRIEGPQADVPVIGGELDGFENPGASEAENPSAGENDHESGGR